MQPSTASIWADIRAAGQRKITRAFATASGGGEYVDKERLAAAFLSHGLILKDRPEGELTVHGSSQEVMAMDKAAPTVASAMMQIGKMTHAMRAMGDHAFMRTQSEEDAMASIASEATPGTE